MLELPEVTIMEKQLNEAIAGSSVRQVLPPTKAHKFCWYNGEPEAYDEKLFGCTVVAAEGFGIFAELLFDNGQRLCFNDGVNARLIPAEKPIPKDYQLALSLLSGETLVFTVAMYGGIILHSGDYDNTYYIKSREALSPFSEAFEGYYRDTLSNAKQTLSAKAFLATEQRFPGIGNGVLQDILFSAHIHPKRKLATLSDSDKSVLLSSIRAVLRDMTDAGGRDTERDLFGNLGGYITKMSKLTLARGCPVCGGEIKKETYLGGSVYYCPNCQQN